MSLKHEQVLHQKIKSFNFINILGQGAFARVYEALDQRDFSQVAVKAIPQKLMVETPKLQELVKTQINVLRSCKNDNIIKYVDSFSTSKTIFIVTQFCNGGDLQKYLKIKVRLTEDEATQFLKQILNGFKGLHEVGAMHRDFKLANILLHNGICKIADLGFAKQLKKTHQMTSTILGTSLTMAPEVLDQKPYGMQADLWSIGVVYYQMIYGRYPYNGLNDFDILRKIKNNRPDYSAVMISKECRDFIDKCLTVNPKNRIKWNQVYQHELLTKSEGRLIYHVMKSKLQLDKNVDYYKDNNNFKNFDENSKKNLLDVNWDEGNQIRQSVNLNKMVEEKQQKQRKNKNIAKYEKLYINERNSIMFIFKFICPHVHKIAKIKANHGIALFIMSKRAFIDTKDFLNKLKGKHNKFDLKQNWQDFIDSAEYYQIIEQSKDDLEMISASAISYSFDIEIKSKQVQAELNIDSIHSKNWNKLVTDIINQYWFLLAEGIDNLQYQNKQTLLSVLQALDYYRENKIANVQQFAKKMQVLNYKQTESKIKKKLMQIYQ